MGIPHEYVNTLQCRLKSYASQLREFRTGEKYLKMKQAFRQLLEAKDKETANLKLELAKANSRADTIRNNWSEIMDDQNKEHEKAIRGKDRELKKMEERALRAERRNDKFQDEILKLKREIYRVLTKLEEEQGKNLKLKAQLERDYENSSVPSSMKMNRKKIMNSREKTGRKPGGQPGHEGHGRKKQTPTNIIFIPAPSEYADNPDYKLTGKIITKQVVNITVSLSVDEYSTPELRHIHTRQLVHAEFPEGAVNDVNYGGSVKAFAFLLNNHCCVSIDKVRDFMSELTDGKLQISKGMINGLSKEFATKTVTEQKQAFELLLRSPVMGVDLTTSRVNGKNIYITLCANDAAAMYFARQNKGHKGVKGTPVIDFQGILVHDHDPTFYNYGSAHQECLAHILRYLLGSIEYEKNLTWNIQMRKLIQEMIHYVNTLADDEKADPDKVKDFECKYLQILKTAETEYEYEPPSKYYMDGYNLYLRLFKFKDSHLLFLHDERVPTTNNLCERLLRIFKRKQKQVMTFRSLESVEYLCVSMSIINQLRTNNQNLFSSTTSIFN